MKEPQYGIALKRAWQLTWLHKELWVFGLFAAFLGQMGLVEILSQSIMAAMNIDNPSGIMFAWYALQDLLLSLTGITLDTVDYVGATWLVVLLAVLGIAMLYVSIVSQGALVHSAARYARSRRKKMANIHTSWYEGCTHFWRLLGLHVIRKLIIVVFASFVAWGTVNAVLNPSFGDQILYLFIFVLATLIGMVLSIWLMYAIGYVVVEEYKLIAAMRSGWRLFTTHWLVSFEIGFVLILLNIVLVFFIFIAMFFFFLPTFFLWSIAITLGGNATLMSIGLMVGVILASMGIIFLGTLFTTYSTTVWTYLFTKMHKHGLVSHVVDLFHGKRARK